MLTPEVQSQHQCFPHFALCGMDRIRCAISPDYAVIEEDGNGVELQGIITTYKPDRSISFHLESRVNVVDVVYFVEAIQGGTRLSTGNFQSM